MPFACTGLTSGACYLNNTTHRCVFLLFVDITRYKVMSRSQRHIEVEERHLVFKGLMQLNYNVLVFTHFYTMSVCIVTCTYLVMTYKGTMCQLLSVGSRCEYGVTLMDKSL